METESKRIYASDRKHWFDRKDLGEIRMGWYGVEITTSFSVDGTNYFKLAAGDAYFRDADTFIIFDYRGVVIYKLSDEQAMHLFRPDEEEINPKSSVRVDVSDREYPVAIISSPGSEPIRIDIFRSLHSFSPGRNYF